MPLTIVLDNLKKIKPNCLYYYSDVSPNMKIFECFSLYNLTKSDYKWADVVFFMNIEESFITRSLMYSYKKETIWANTHGSYLAEKASVIVPVTTFFEDVYHFINAEGRMQHTQAPIKGTNEILPSWKLAKLLNKSLVADEAFNKWTIPYQNPRVFLHSKFNTIFVSFFRYSKIITMYPLKSNIEDFHLTNSITRASGIMGKCSQAFRNCQTNFVKL